MRQVRRVGAPAPVLSCRGTGSEAVPATEYYQQRTIGKQPQRYVITRKDGRPMAIAGLWDSYVWPDKRIERTYCIVTVEATGTVAEIHDRMPLVLEQADWPLWLGEVRVVRPVGRRKESDRNV